MLRELVAKWPFAYHVNQMRVLQRSTGIASVRQQGTASLA